MTCCISGIDQQFSRAIAQRDLERYARKGPDKTTRLIIDAVKRGAMDGAALLDIGAGVGVIHHELLSDRVATAVHVEAAQAYLEAATRESERRGHEGRVRFVLGDVTDIAGELEAADVVTLDRVICCYANMEPLVQAAVTKSRRMFVASYPRDRWYVRAVMAAENLVRRIRSNPFRTYVHSVARIEELLVGDGLKRTLVSETLVWRIVAFSR